MNYKEGLEWLEERLPSRIENSTRTIEVLLDRLGNPQDQIKTIHVAGSNGKGSVCEYLRSILVKSSYRVGLFISPHIIDIRETIQVGMEYISQDDFLEGLEEIVPHIEDMDREGVFASSFEIMVALAFGYFQRKKLDIAIIEVGLGGRDDATNVMKKPLLEVFTPISLDHIDILGSSLKEIARVKAGIIKKNSLAISSPQEAEVAQVLEEFAQDQGARLEFLKTQDIEILDMNPDYSLYNYSGLRNIRTNLHGSHQVYNSALAILACQYLRNYYDFLIEDDHILEGLRETRNLGRIEWLSKKPGLIIDGAHNKASIDNLIDYLRGLDYKRLILGFGILGDKDYPYIMEELLPLADHLILTDVDNPRSLSLEDLKKEAGKYKEDALAIEDKKKALEKSLSLAQEDDLVLWCGSFYLIKEVRKIFLDQNQKN